MRRYRHFLISCILHGLAAGVLLVWLLPRLPPETEPSRISESMLIEVEKPEGRIRGHSKPRQRGQPSGGSGIKLGDLGINLGIGRKTSRPGSGDRPEPNVGLDIQGDPHHSIYAYIYEAIDRNLTYPYEFVQRDMEGEVHARLYFTAAGEFIREKSTIDSVSPFFKVVVARTLRRALRDPLPATMGKFKEPFVLNCVFHFDITEHHDEELAKSYRAITSKRFAFYRYFHKSVLEWELGPFAGLGPLVHGLNPLWFVKKAKGLISNDVKIDPLDQYRQDPEY